MTGSKSLNSWARFAGYSDFDTYIRAGGSVLDARRDIEQRISRLQSALDALGSNVPELYPALPNPMVEEARKADAEPKIEPASDWHLTRGATYPPLPNADEPTDPANAHVQGADE